MNNFLYSVPINYIISFKGGYFMTLSSCVIRNIAQYDLTVNLDQKSATMEEANVQLSGCQCRQAEILHVFALWWYRQRAA